MNKIKKFTLISACVLLVCVVLCTIMIPITINNTIADLNTALNGEETVYNEVVLDENVKEMNLILYEYPNISIRKSIDNKTHIMFIDRGFYKFDCEKNVKEDKSEVLITRKTNNLQFDKKTVVKSIKSFIDSSNDIIITVPEQMNIICDDFMLKNPYTHNYYENTGKVQQSQIANIYDIKTLRNEIRDDLAKIETIKIESKQDFSSIQDFYEATQPIYSDILDRRINLVQSSCDRFYNCKDNPEMELLVYNLTDAEQERDYAQMELEVYKRKLISGNFSRNEYDNEVKKNNERIDSAEKKIDNMTEIFNEFCTGKYGSESNKESVEANTSVEISSPQEEIVASSSEVLPSSSTSEK